MTEAQGEKESLYSEGHPERLPEGEAGALGPEEVGQALGEGTQKGKSKSKGSEAGAHRPEEQTPTAWGEARGRL